MSVDVRRTTSGGVAATLAEAARHERDTGRKRRYRDRQTTYPQDWSHARFVQLIEDSPRD